MSTREEAIADVSTWELDHEYTDASEKPIKCDNTRCTLGNYAIKYGAASTTYFPGCTTCEFAGDLDDVFDEAEPRFEPGAPEDYKLGAARVMATDGRNLLDIMRSGRSEAVALIEDYVAKTPVAE